MAHLFLLGFHFTKKEVSNIKKCKEEKVLEEEI